MADFLNELAYAGSPYEGKANLTGMKPEFMSSFDQMAQEYYSQTGKEIKIDDAWRSHETQAKAYADWQAGIKKAPSVARPGHSKHETGLAMDINSEQANELSKMGLLDKYGFHRPVKGEPWHVQIRDLERETSAVAAKVNPDFMSELNSVGDFSQELSGIGQPTPTAEAQTTPQAPPQPAAMGGFRETPAPAPEQTAPGKLSPEQIAQAAEQGENVANLPSGTAQPLSDLATKAMPVARPALEMGGMMAGGVLGTGATPGVGTVAGAGIGYALGKKVADAIESYAGQKPPPELVESIIQSVKDVGTGAMMEMGGQAGGVALQAGLKGAGKVGSAVLGRMSGVGTGAVEEALKGGPAFTKALRGQITGEEVVDVAKGALQSLKDARGLDYTTKLADIGAVRDPAGNAPVIDTTAIDAKLRDLMKQYRVKVDPTTSELDFGSVAIGNKGRKDIKDMIETVWTWTDKSPLGLDALKRYLGDFYSESSQARAFTTALYNSVRDTLTREVPQYAEMTQGYSEATKLIKDLEAGLMLRKQGMTGRVVADQTLRRLTSAMRDNFPLRRDLVNALGAKTGEDLAGMVAGTAMSQILPRGLAGTGPALIGEAALAKLVSPAFWPVLVASSPRVQGEFLNIYGKAIKEMTGFSIPTARIAAYFAGKKAEEADKDSVMRAVRRGKMGVDEAVDYIQRGATKQ